MTKLITITIISTICILAIFVPITFMGEKHDASSCNQRFSIYATDGEIDTTLHTEEDIELSFY